MSKIAAVNSSRACVDLICGVVDIGPNPDVMQEGLFR